MDDKLAASLLQQIELQGGVSDESGAPLKVFINTQLNNVLDFSSGKKRIKPLRVEQFHMILSQPSVLRSHSPLEIRCLNCNRVISYPAWHYELRFDRNIFEYFVCFSEVSPLKVSLNCRK